jgi:putative Mn2+ efflux pump MntP
MATAEVPKVRRGLEIGGIVAAVVLIVVGVVSIVMGIDGRDTVTTSIERENIVGTPDMTPSAIAAEAKEAGLTNVELPSCDVANQPIDDGDSAKCFASYMRVHALEATGGYTYAEMGQFEAKPNTPKGELSPGGGTSNEQFAAIDPETGQAVENGAREVWVTETALSTALNASYMADKLSLFGIVIGIVLLLIGIGFAVLVAGGSVRDPDSVLKFLRSHKPHVGHKPAESH